MTLTLSDKKIPYLLKKDLTILFVGINPTLSPTESGKGHFFCGRTNQFWSCLSQSGVVPPNQHVPADDQWLFKYYDIGFINFVERPTRAQRNIYPKEFIQGAKRTKEIIAKYKPKVVCFVGTSIYKHFQSGLPENNACGPQRNYVYEDGGKRNGCLIFVVPSTSAKARGYSVQEKKDLFKSFSLFLDRNEIIVSLCDNN